MKCTVCGELVDKLDYGKLKIQSITTMRILDEKVKNKETRLDLTLCKTCRVLMLSEIMQRALSKPQEPQLQDHDVEAIQYAIANGLAPKPPADPDCNHDCANCEGAR